MTPRYVFGGTATAVALVLAVMTYANLEPATDGPVSVPPRPGIDGPVAAGPDASADRRAEGEKPDAPSKLALLQGNERDSASAGKASPAKPKTEAPAGADAPQRRPAGEQSADEAKAFASKPLADAQKPGDVVVQGRLSPAPQELTASTGAAVPQRGAPQAAPTTMAERQNQPPVSGRAKAKESFERRSGLSQGGSAGVASAIGKMARNIAPSPTSKNRGRALQRGDQVRSHYQDTGRDQFQSVTENEIKRVGDAPVSTFSVDVDTASYAFVRRMLNRGRLPQKNAVRVEELVNYFDYDYPLPAARERPFEPSVTVMESPWKKGNKLVHIGIRGYDIDTAEKPRSNLVFLLDVSGSMNAPDKLPLMVSSMKLLLNGLQPEDTVAIVVYAGASGTVLEPTKVAEKHKILAALDRLRAGGSTAGAAGIRQAYALAEGTFDKTAVNRVILATDGDFNVGITNREELKGYVERKRKTGVFLSVLGFGQGNLNDHLMQTLAQNGNGVAAHIDTLNEARKVLVEEASSTLFPIAKDVKIQVEFNPATVSEYRLVGYETRALKRQDFANDKVDAGDIGAGHTVTAIYEITPVKGGNPVVEGNRYQSAQPAAKASGTKFENEYAFLKIRYKLPASDTSSLITVPITVAEADGGKARTDNARRLREARWATAVAGFGQILKGGKYTASFSYEDVIAMARAAKGEDNFGYRSEFINLVRLARSAAGSPRK